MYFYWTDIMHTKQWTQRNKIMKPRNNTIYEMAGAHSKDSDQVTRARLLQRETGLSPPPPVIYYWPFQGDASVVVYSNCQCSSA